jgi:hypothetical protein
VEQHDLSADPLQFILGVSVRTGQFVAVLNKVVRRSTMMARCWAISWLYRQVLACTSSRRPSATRWA